MRSVYISKGCIGYVILLETALTVRTSCLVVIAGVRAIFACPTAEMVGSIPAEAIFNYSRRFRAFEKFAIDYRNFLKRPTGTLG